MAIRTDLALEQLDLCGKTHVPGVSVREETVFGQPATVVEIKNRRGAEALGKPQGIYITMEVENVLRRESESFRRAVACAGGYIEKLLPFGKSLPVLVAGLGNRGITPDGVGPLTADHILVTRHMIGKLPKPLESLRPVSAFAPGVLGTTGLESAEIIRALVKRTGAAGVIAVDAIAAREDKRLCSTIQISDCGIAPGSGIGNRRQALNRETLGVPVIAVGVPTVTDAGALAEDLCRRAGVSPPELPGRGMIVTCSDIDRRVREISRVLAFAINSALQPELTIDDLEDLTF